METIDFEAAGLTRQQADIMQAALNTRAKGLRCTPSEIQREYERLTGKAIQKPNFFTQLRILSNASLMLKSDGEYAVDLKGISKALAEQRKALAERLENLELQSKSLEDMAVTPAHSLLPPIQYQSLEKYFGSLMKQLDEAGTFYCNSVFPWPCFSYPLARAAGSPEYYERLIEEMEDSSKSFKYISSFDCRFLAELALKASKGDRDIALRECLRALENMRNRLKLCPNLQIHYVPKTFSLHFVVIKPAGSRPRNTYLFSFGKPGAFSNGVIINSPEIAESMCRVFEDLFEESLDMRSPKAERVYSMLAEELKEILGSGKHGSEAVAGKVYGLLTTGKYKRDEPKMAKDLQDRLRRFVAEGRPVKLVGLWGFGPKNADNWADEETCKFLAELDAPVKKAYPPGLEFTFVFATPHGTHNGIPMRTMAAYAKQVAALFKRHGFKHRRLEELWKKYGITFNKIDETLSRKPAGWWERVENAALIERNAARRNRLLGPGEAAQRYFVMRELEKPAFKSEFPNSIFIAFADQRLKGVLPDMPTLYLKTRRGWSNAPWFVTENKREFEQDG